MLKNLALSVMAAFSLTAAPLAEAELFQNSYVSFEMPDKWKCKTFGTDWVCHSVHAKKQKEAMVVMTAKLAGAMDNLETYVSFLEQPRAITSKSGVEGQSKPLHSKKISVNNHLWVDGFHKNSEVPKYFTRYMATVCCEGGSSKLAILLALSANERHYSKYAADFLKLINSLRVQDIKKAIARLKEMGQADSMGDIGAYMEGVLAGEDLEGDGGPGGFFGLSPVQVGGLGAAAGGGLLSYLYLMRRRRRGGKRRSGGKDGRERSSRRRSRSSRRG